jgi:uncharacterized FlaG/YvyC family protein
MLPAEAVKILNKAETYRKRRWEETEKKIMKAIVEVANEKEGIVRTGQIEKKTSLPRKTISKHMKQHLDKGIAERVSKGVYQYYVGIKNLDKRKVIKKILKKGLLEGYRMRGGLDEGAVLQFPPLLNSDWKIKTFIDKVLGKELRNAKNLPDDFMLIYITELKKFKK